MYRCESCDLLVGPHVRAHRRVVETRRVTFPRRARSQPVPNKPAARWNDDPGGVGDQIVREITCCRACASG